MVHSMLQAHKCFATLKWDHVHHISLNIIMCRSDNSVYVASCLACNSSY